MFNVKKCNKGSCVVPLHNKSECAQACSVLNGITHAELPATQFIPVGAEPHLEHYIRHLQQQSPTVYKVLHISPTHERMIVCVKLESATGS